MSLARTCLAVPSSICAVSPRCRPEAFLYLAPPESVRSPVQVRQTNCVSSDPQFCVNTRQQNTKGDVFWEIIANSCGLIHKINNVYYSEHEEKRAHFSRVCVKHRGSLLQIIAEVFFPFFLRGERVAHTCALTINYLWWLSRGGGDTIVRGELFFLGGGITDKRKT